MDTNKETIVLELSPKCRLDLNSQIAAQMELKGYDSSDWSTMKLGNLPMTWPINGDDKPTIAELVLIARKLDMQIVISDFMLIPQNTATVKKPEDGR